MNSKNSTGHMDAMAGLPASGRAAAASKPSKPHYTGNWLRCCDRCEHAEPHYCLLYSRTMKNMDCKTCRSWQERQNAACDWKYESETKRCKQPATTINPPTGLKYCACHTKRFHGMEDLVPLKPQNDQAHPTAAGGTGGAQEKDAK